MIHRIIYQSIAHPRFGTDHVDQVLYTARRNNRRDGITGLLIQQDRAFFQCLEGEKSAVLACFLRILSDWRHQEVQLIHAADRPSREFGEWAMAYGDAARFVTGANGAAVACDLATAEDPKLAELIARFVRDHEIALV